MQKNFHERLTELRQAHALTRSQFAEMLNISPVSLQRYEVGDRIPDVDFLIKLHNNFSVDINWLILGQKSTDLPDWQTDYTADDLRLISYLQQLSPKAKQSLLTFIDNIIVLQ